MGVNVIEREGISYEHPAKFTLVGTMNPEEGDLRPQLLDRFGLVVEVRGEEEIKNRVEVIKRRLEFEENGEDFYQTFERDQKGLAQKIVQATGLLHQVKFDDRLLETVARISTTLEVDGHRADIVMIKTAMTIAAFDGRTSVGMDDLRQAAKLVLPHRMRRQPFDNTGTGSLSIEDTIDQITSNLSLE
jgi:Mg-chelatase subunit ChlI